MPELPTAGEHRPRDRGVVGAGRRRRRRRAPDRAARRPLRVLHGARRRRARPRGGAAALGARHRRARACTAARRGAPGRTSTSTASGRSRCSATSCCRAGRCRSHGYDAVFFVSGDVEALRSARAARLLAATLRERPTLREGGVPLDLLVGSLNDAGERYDDSLDAEVVVLTDGGAGRHGRTASDSPPPHRPARSPTPTARATRSRRRSARRARARRRRAGGACTSRARAGAAVITGQGPYTRAANVLRWARPSPGSPPRLSRRWRSRS